MSLNVRNAYSTGNEIRNVLTVEQAEDHFSWRLTWRWINKLGGIFVSHVRRVGTGFTIAPDLLDKMDELRGNTSRSRILEALVKLYIKDPSILEQV